MSEEKSKVLDVNAVMRMIPHRYPLLLVDRIVEIVKGESAIGLKNVTINEPHFAGHFPGFPVMPGVLIIEAMAQTAATVVVDFLGDQTAGKVVYFMTIDSARFRKPIVPGDTVYIHVKKTHSRGAVWKFEGEAKVDGKICAEALFSAMITDKNSDAA